jgi:curved DNA-binding protein CbpA
VPTVFDWMRWKRKSADGAGHRSAELMQSYRVLGLSCRAGREDVKRQYRALAMRYHPDRNPGNAQAAERFKVITHAYNTLRVA